MKTSFKRVSTPHRSESPPPPRRRAAEPTPPPADAELFEDDLEVENTSTSDDAYADAPQPRSPRGRRTVAAQPAPATAPTPPPPPRRAPQQPPPPTKPLESEEESSELESEPLAVVDAKGIMSQPVGSGLGELDMGDYEMVWLKVLQSNSPLVLEAGFAPGQIVLQQSTDAGYLLHDPPSKRDQGTDPVRLTVLNMEKQFIEVTEFGGAMPRTFQHAADAQAAGLRPYGPINEGYRPIAVAVVLIEEPKLRDPEESGAFEAWFPYEHDGKRYALALWQIGGKSYSTAKKLWTALSRRLGGFFPNRQWELTDKLTPNPNGTMSWQSILKDGGPNTPEFIQFIHDCAG